MCDDAAAVSLAMRCTNGGSLDPPKPSTVKNWGHYSEWVKCPQNTAICGIRTRVEHNCGSNCDDTALNAVEFYCCKVQGMCIRVWKKLYSIILLFYLK